MSLVKCPEMHDESCFVYNCTVEYLGCETGDILKLWIKPSVRDELLEVQRMLRCNDYISVNLVDVTFHPQKLVFVDENKAEADIVRNQLSLTFEYNEPKVVGSIYFNEKTYNFSFNL